MYEINLVCPVCGECVWEGTETGVFICSDCGNECTTEEMEIRCTLTQWGE